MASASMVASRTQFSPSSFGKNGVMLERGEDKRTLDSRKTDPHVSKQTQFPSGSALIRAFGVLTTTFYARNAAISPSGLIFNLLANFKPKFTPIFSKNQPLSGLRVVH